MTIGNTDNPTGVDGTISMGSNGDTHTVNSDTAASPTPRDSSLHDGNDEPPPIGDNAPVANVTNDNNDEPPSTDNDAMPQTQHHTTPQQNDTNVSSTRKRRRSHGPGREASRKVFYASKESNITDDPGNQGGADARGGDRGGA